MMCKHWQNGKQIPCPPMCPHQCWPKFMFKSTLWGGGWKLRKEHRTP